MHPSFSTSFRIHRIAVLSSLMIALLSSSVYALTYPGSTPPGEVTGGTYRTYFDNMFFAPCPTGQTIRGFSSSGVPNCIAGAAALSISGALGYTLYHDGTNWVSSANIYNTGMYVGIGTTTPGAKLEVNGGIKAGGNYYNVLSWNQNGTPVNGVKIKTKIPYTSGTQMPLIMIEGYDYGNGSPIGISMVWYIFGGNFINYKASSWGNITPAITLANEGGFVTIHLGWTPYYARFSVRAYAQGMSESSSWFSGWTVADEVAGTTNAVVVGYNNRFPGVVNFASGIWNSNGRVGIGTTSPTAQLEVAGQVKITGGTPGVNKVLVSDATGLASWQNTPTPCVPAGSGIENECYGSGALQANLTGPFNVAFGFGALTMNSNGGVNTAIGNKALRDNTTGSYNSVVGGGAMKLNQTGYFNSALGANALGDNITGNSNVAIGSAALRNSTNASYNIAIGDQALWGLEYGDGNIGIGLNASVGSGSNNIIIGNNLALASGSINQLNIGNWIYGSGGNIGIGTNSSLTAKLTVAGQIKITGGSPAANKVLVSDAAGLASWQSSPASCTPTGTGVNNQCYGVNSMQNNTSGNGNTAVGDYSLRDIVTGYENTSIGYYASRHITSGYENTGIGAFAMGASLGSQNVGIGKYAMGGAGGDGNQNTAVGYASMPFGSVGDGNIALGSMSMGNGVAGNDNVAIGKNSMYWIGALGALVPGDNNVAVGRNTMYHMSSGSSNTAVGYRAMENVGGGSMNNVALGEYAGYGVYGYGLNNYNVFLGSRAGLNIGTGSSNVAIGYSAGSSMFSGNYNIAIGHGAQVVSGTGSNQLNIGNWIYGNGGNIGIGTSSSLTTRLTVGGQIKITGGSPGLGKVLISDANGVGTWATYVSGSTATGITGGVQNYVSKFGTGGNGLYASQIFDNGTNVAIGTGTATKKLTIDSNLVNDSGLRLSRISSTSTAYTGAAMGLGVDVNGNVIPISNGDVVVYDGIDRASPPTPDPNIAGRQISYDFNNFFDIPTKQSFVVSDGSSASNNGPYFKENGSSAVCSWNGTYGSSAYNCATADPVTGLSASPHNSFTMTAKGTTFGYQIALGARGDAPLFARSGRFNGAQGGGLYTNDSPYQTPAPWQKVLTVPANHPEYLYVNTGLNSQLQTQTGGGNVGIGTTFPNSRFEVWTGATTSPLLHFRGANNVAMGLGAMNVAVSGNANSAYGAESLFSITTGYSNAAFGYRALRTNAGGYNNVSVGQESLFSNNGGSWNSAVGYQALYSNSSGTGNIAFGPQALYNLTTGNSNIAIGYQAARVIAGSSVSRNIAIGYQSLYSATTSDLVAIGHRSLYANSSGVRNTAIGYQTLDAVTTGSGNTAVGYDTLGQTTGSNNTAYGNGAGNGITSGSNNIAIGSNAQVPTATASNQLSIGNWIYGNGGNIGIGTGSSLTKKLTIYGGDMSVNGIIAGQGGTVYGQLNTTFGELSMIYNTTGLGNTAIGNGTLSSNTTGNQNTAIGLGVLISSISGDFNTGLGAGALNMAVSTYGATAIGAGALQSNKAGIYNTAVGVSSMAFTSSGSYNTTLGVEALNANNAYYNTAVGYQSLRNGGSSTGNTSVGSFALYNSIGGSYNTALGFQAGTGLTSGSNNIALGYNTVFPSSTASNQLNIGNWIYGNGGNIGIGTSSSLTAKFTVAGTVKLGTNGSTLNNIIKVANALDVPSVAAGACTAQTTTVTNAAVGGVASVSPASALTDRMIIAYARVSAANTVEIKFCNESAAPIDLASMSYYISVIQ